MSKPIEYGVKRHSVNLPMSRGLLIEHGVVEPTAEERAEMERQAAAARAWRAERDAERAIARERLAAITDPLARVVLDLHAEGDSGCCAGCDFDGYEAESPTWPCRTIETVAAHYGIPLEAS